MLWVLWLNVTVLILSEFLYSVAIVILHSHFLTATFPPERTAFEIMLILQSLIATQ